MNEIKKFEELVQNYIGPDKTIVEKTSQSLLEPGENYFSDMRKIRLVLKNKETENDEVLDLVAKCAIQNPIGPDFEVMEHEMKFYTKIIPALRKFEEKSGSTLFSKSDIFPKFIGGRLNLTGDDKSDMDAVLILENLIEQGYQNADRHIGFDLAAAKNVLKDLAILHSTFLSFKLLDPEKFKTEVRDMCKDYTPSPTTNEDDILQGPPNCFPLIIQYLKSDEKFSHIIPGVEKASERYNKLMVKFENFFNKPVVEPFCTFCHNDMWVNNTMQKIQDGVVVSNKFVDFQMFRICSLTADLIFFLISSVQSPILRTEFDNLIRYYYETFRKVLEDYSSYTPQFSYENFLEELKINIDDAITQTMIMLPVVFKEKGKKFDPTKEMTLEDIPESARARIVILFLELNQRNWL